jgi:hypothetical protein
VGATRVQRRCSYSIVTISCASVGVASFQNWLEGTALDSVVIERDEEAFRPCSALAILDTSR